MDASNKAIEGREVQGMESSDQAYYSKLVIMAGDGRIRLHRVLDMLETSNHPFSHELYELAILQNDLSITVGSERESQMNLLMGRYFTNEAIHYEVW